MTVVEVELLNLGRRFQRHVDRTETLLEKLDARMDRTDVLMARLLAGISVLIFLGQLLAPAVGRLLGLPT